MSEELILRLKAPVSMSMFATKTDLYMDVLQQRKDAAARIEELEQKLRTTSLEALAISDTNNEFQARIAGLEDVLEEKRENINELRGLLEYSENSIALLERKWQFQMDRADASQARLSEAVKVLEPFAEAAECIDANDDYSSAPIWEHPAAMNITIGDIRRAQRFITTLGGD